MRGVNKLVVEVRPDGDCFEKALLFLRPGTSQLPQKQISDSAEKLLFDIENNRNYRKLNYAKSALLVISGAAAGSALSWIMFFVFGML